MARNSHTRNTHDQLAGKRSFLVATNLAATVILALFVVAQAAPAAENDRHHVASAATDGALILEDLIWG
ncbi:hypothetical protein [Streptomyces sp. NPDC056361]|uniref:hypothetical protein n=1 Tax=Streptomyces sp. NPDC056361 TaxID=3345795 RepID=UPI0035D65A3B